MPRGTVAALSSSRGGPEVNLYPLDGGPPRSVSIAASYVPAFDVDREGNFWAWDAEERRVRILTPSGTEVFSIRPLFSASAMPLPQRLEVLDDGSFLLCGSAEVWKFQASGVPVWRLARIPGRPGEALPATFELGVNRATGSFVVLDAQSRRLLAFSDSPEGEAARLAALFTRLDARKQADVRELAGLARSSGLPLMALQFGDLLARGGGTGPEREAARVAILWQKATGYSALAEGLARDLLFERADAAYRRTADALRGLTAESPDDSAAASLLQTVIARGREVRAALAGPASARIVSARLVAERRQSCSSKLTLLLRLRNTGTLALTGVRVHADIPGVVTAPSLAALDALSPAAERELSIPFGTIDDDELPSAAEVPGFALFTADRAQEGISFSMSFAAQVTLNGEARSLADILACRAVTRDTLAASLPVSLLSGTAPGAPQPLAELAGILGALGAARGELPTEAGVESTAAPDGADQPSMPMPAREGMRAALRSLSRDEAGWTVVTASIAMSQGMPAAIVSIGNRAVALVDTGVPLLDALAGVPDLGRFRRELDAVSRGGTLWIPLSGRVPPPGARPWSWSLEDALELLAGGGAAGLKRADLVQSGDRENAPIPFPLFLPVAAELPSLDALRAAARAAANAAARGIGSP